MARCLFYLIILAFLVMGCRSSKAVITKDVIDSTRITVTPRLIPIEIPERKLGIQMWIKCDPVTNKPIPVTQEFKGENTKAVFNLDDQGNMTGNVTCDSLQRLVEVRDSTIIRLRKESTVTEKIIEVHKARWYDHLSYAANAILIILTLILLLFKR
jgi:hypothetical protein